MAAPSSARPHLWRRRLLGIRVVVVHVVLGVVVLVDDGRPQRGRRGRGGRLRRLLVLVAVPEQPVLGGGRGRGGGGVEDAVLVEAAPVAGALVAVVVVVVVPGASAPASPRVRSGAAPAPIPEPGRARRRRVDRGDELVSGAVEGEALRVVVQVLVAGAPDAGVNLCKRPGSGMTIKKFSFKVFSR